jgi:hypothetical protein
VGIGVRKIVSVVAYDASSFAMRISWLNFEPWSQSFLQSKPISGIDCLSYSGQHHCSFCIVSIGVRRIFHKIAKDVSKPAVSWLKFEPKVSNFPFDKSQRLAFINLATGKIHCSFCIEGMRVRKVLSVVAYDASSLACASLIV